MKRFIEGESRDQLTMFPNVLEDYIAEDNPVRVIEAFVEELELHKLGFLSIEPMATGRPAYHPSTMLKIYIYGYLNKIQSSRRLERETQRNLELIWLTNRLTPDFKTIANFRRDNGKPIIGVCREFIQVCRRLELFTQAMVAIDGSKFKAMNSGDKNFTPVRLKRRRDGIEKHIARYLSELDEADKAAKPLPEGKTERIKEKLANLKKEMKRLDGIGEALEKSADNQISLTDPDARVMATARKNSGVVGYNVQSAVDTKNHLIVAHEVTNQVTDRDQLTSMGKKARFEMGREKLKLLADRGYYNSKEFLECKEEGLKAFVPKTITSNSRAAGRFSKAAFSYEGRHDQYRCPAGERLPYHHSNEENGLTIRYYYTSVCPDCELRSQCTTGKQRRVRRWEHESILEEMEKALEKDPKKMSIRRQTVEHPFGTIKSWMGSTHFLTRTLENVSTEMSLHVLAYNLKRVMQIIGVKSLIRAVTA